MSQTFDSNVDYYKVLGLNEKATLDELKQAHIELALKYHPDTASAADQEQVDRADKFIKVTEAWKVLSNSAVRANYDAVRLSQTSHTVGTFTRSSFVGASRYAFFLSVCSSSGDSGIYIYIYIHML
jgi:DnaJ-class molecular chaperone